MSCASYSNMVLCMHAITSVSVFLCANVCVCVYCGLQRGCVASTATDTRRSTAGLCCTCVPGISCPTATSRLPCRLYRRSSRPTLWPRCWPPILDTPLRCGVSARGRLCVHCTWDVYVDRPMVCAGPTDAACRAWMRSLDTQRVFVDTLAVDGWNATWLSLQLARRVGCLR